MKKKIDKLYERLGKTPGKPQNVESALNLFGVTKFQEHTLKQFRGEDYWVKNANEIVGRLEKYKNAIKHTTDGSVYANFDQFIEKELVAVYDHQELYESLVHEVTQQKHKWKLFEDASQEIIRKLELPQEEKTENVLRFIRNQNSIIEALPVIQEALKDEILVDIFSGNTFNPNNFSEPKATFYVDKYGDPNERVEKDGKYHIKQDALQFLCLLPNESVNLAMNGVDPFVINFFDRGPGEEYMKALKTEIDRTMKKGGVLFAIANDYAEKIEENFDVLHRSMVADSMIYQKKST